MLKTGFKEIEDFEKFEYFLEYKKVEELYIIALNIYDFDNKFFRFLPFSGGYTEQEDQNPKFWQLLNFIITEVLKWQR